MPILAGKLRPAVVALVCASYSFSDAAARRDFGYAPLLSQRQALDDLARFMNLELAANGIPVPPALPMD